MVRALLTAVAVVLVLAPAGVGVGLWLAVSSGAGVVGGSLGYGLLAVWALSADLLPDRVEQ